MKKIVDIEKWRRFYKESIKGLDMYDHFEQGMKLGYSLSGDWIGSQPDAEEKHGKWNIRSIDFLVYGKNDVEFYIECSVCGRTVKLTDENPTEYRELCKKYPYCHCGAKMDLGAEEKKAEITLSTNNKIKRKESKLKYK